MPHRQTLVQARAGLVPWVTLLVVAIACGRTGLDRNVPASPGASTGGANLGGTTASGGANPGGTTASGGVRVGGAGSGGSGSGGATSDAGCAAYPPPSCVPGPAAATVIGDYDDGWNVAGLASSGEELFIATSHGDGTWLRGRIVRVSLRTLATETYDLQGSPGELRYRARAVLYRPTFYNPSDPFELFAPAVARWDLRTGVVANLPNPAEFPSSDTGSLTANAKGQIFWSMRQDDRTAIARWDPCTAQTDLLIANRDAVELLADDEAVYWQEPRGGRAEDFLGHMLLYSLATGKGATASLLVDEAAYSWNAPGLLAVDDERLYYRTDKEPELGVQAISKRGGTPQSVIPDADPLRLDSSTIDGTHIYWVGFDVQDTLRRTPKRGGATDAFWSGKDRFLQAVTVDDCNVYWAAANPPAIYYRAK